MEKRSFGINDRFTAYRFAKHVSRRGDFGAAHLDAAELGLPAFGAVIPARELGNALLRRLDRCADLQRIAPAQAVVIEAGMRTRGEPMRSRRSRTRATSASRRCDINAPSDS